MTTKMECLTMMKSYSGLHVSTVTRQILGTTMTSATEKDLQTHWMQVLAQMQSTMMTTTIRLLTPISTISRKAKPDSLATMEANQAIGTMTTTVCLMKTTKHLRTSRSIYLILCGLMHSPHPSSVGTSTGSIQSLVPLSLQLVFQSKSTLNGQTMEHSQLRLSMS